PPASTRSSPAARSPAPTPASALTATAARPTASATAPTGRGPVPSRPTRHRPTRPPQTRRGNRAEDPRGVARTDTFSRGAGPPPRIDSRADRHGFARSVFEGEVARAGHRPGDQQIRSVARPAEGDADAAGRRLAGGALRRDAAVREDVRQDDRRRAGEGLPLREPGREGRRRARAAQEVSPVG